MKLNAKIIQSIKFGRGRLVCTNWERNNTLHRNVYYLDENDEIIWQIEEPEDLSFVGIKGEAYMSIWFEGEIFVADTSYGNDYSIDLETGKRAKRLRFNK